MKLYAVRYGLANSRRRKCKPKKKEREKREKKKEEKFGGARSREGQRKERTVPRKWSSV